jgi:hypothetical protein
MVDADKAWEMETAACERQIKQTDGTGLKARWNYGKSLVRARGKAKRLPNHIIPFLEKRDGISKTEIELRIQFYEAYPSETKLSNALDSSPSWRDVIKELPRLRRAEPAAKPANVVDRVALSYRRMTKVTAELDVSCVSDETLLAITGLIAELQRFVAEQRRLADRTEEEKAQ